MDRSILLSGENFSKVAEIARSLSRYGPVVSFDGAVEFLLANQDWNDGYCAGWDEATDHYSRGGSFKLCR